VQTLTVPAGARHAWSRWVKGSSIGGKPPMLRGMRVPLTLAVVEALGWLAAMPIPAKAADCFTSTIMAPVPFMGNSEIFQLSDGSFWQVEHEYRYLYLYNPSVIICPSIGKLSVGGQQLNDARLQQPKSE
jgi:hypothetical protein